MAQTPSSEELKEAPWADLLRTTVDELKSFIQGEIRLVSSELGDKAKQAGMGAGMFGAAGFMGVLTAAAFTATLILALSLVLTPWLAGLAVTVLYAAIAGVLALGGKKKVQESTPFVPQQAIGNLQDTKDRVQQAWQEGSEQGSADDAGRGSDDRREGDSFRHIRGGRGNGGPPRY